MNDRVHRAAESVWRRDGTGVSGTRAPERAVGLSVEEDGAPIGAPVRIISTLRELGRDRRERRRGHAAPLLEQDVGFAIPVERADVDIRLSGFDPFGSA